MNFFLGFFPDEKAKYKIGKVIGSIGPVFDGVQIPVRWSKPEDYHMTILQIGDKLSFIKRILLQRRLKKIVFKPFKIRFNTVRLGMSRKYKELIYLDVQEGGDKMRDLLFELRSTLGMSDTGNFLPHLTLGRVRKDLTRQEYGNLCRDLAVVAKDLSIEGISFEVEKLELVKSEEGVYNVLMTLGKPN
jgi:2'-5' RNA ligase